MRVIVISDAVEFGGAEVSLAVLVEALSPEHKMFCLVGERPPDELVKRIRAAGASVQTIRGLGRRPSPRAIFRLVRHVRRAAPSVVHVNLTDQGDGLTPLLASRVWGAPTIATLRCVVPSRSRWRERCSALALGGPDLVIGPSNFVKRYLDGLGIGAVVLPNGVPPPGESPDARAELGLSEGDFVVGGIGRLHEGKGWDVLCRASGEVEREVPRSVFVVVGEGVDRERLERLPACGRVRFLGYRASARSLIAGFDILVIPSRFEAFGRVAVEAMLAGVPVIASNVGGLQEVLDDCALLVSPDNPEMLAREIIKLANNPALRVDLAVRGKRRANELFGIERMVGETLATYDRVIGKA